MIRKYEYFEGPVRNGKVIHRTKQPTLEEADNTFRKRFKEDPLKYGLRISSIPEEEK